MSTTNQKTPTGEYKCPVCGKVFVRQANHMYKEVVKTKDPETKKVHSDTTIFCGYNCWEKAKKPHTKGKAKYK